MKNDFCIQTKKGHRFNPKTGEIKSIDIEDIAHSLSNMSRYAGHCRSFYSVAEHSVLVFEIVKKLWPEDIDSQWAGLLHDATEAYICDIPTPLKDLLPRYRYIEDELTIKIAKKFNINWNRRIKERVKIADKIALSTEAKKLFSSVKKWQVIKNYRSMNILLSKDFPQQPGKSKKSFLKCFKQLEKRFV